MTKEQLRKELFIFDKDFKQIELNPENIAKAEYYYCKTDKAVEMLKNYFKATFDFSLYEKTNNIDYEITKDELLESENPIYSVTKAFKNNKITNDMLNYCKTL